MGGEGLRVYMRDSDSLANNWEDLLFGNFDVGRVIYAVGNQGQVLSFHTKAYGTINSSNKLSSVVVQPFAAEWLAGITIVPKSGEKMVSSFAMVHNDQSYEEGWMAYLNGEKLSHVKVNGWENGWLVPEGADTSRILYIFWPQYLEWGGLVILVMTLGWLGYKARRT